MTPYLETTDPRVRLVWRAILERLEDVTLEDDKRRAALHANKLGIAMGGK